MNLCRHRGPAEPLVILGPIRSGTAVGVVGCPQCGRLERRRVPDAVLEEIAANDCEAHELMAAYEALAAAGRED